MMRRFSLFIFFCVAVGLAQTLWAARVDIVFPTPNTAWTSGRIADFIQPTESGDPESGLFGCVRTAGRRFHEGLDLKALRRDARGEAKDPVFAAMDGVVRHVAESPGSSSYGRYIVIEHTGLTPSVYTLYAHLARIESGIRPGVSVKKGQTIGLMGRSAAGYAIPRERAHLHFEIGLRVTDSFQTWYDRQKFGSRNEHGLWNGMNLIGIDPLDFLQKWRARRVDDFQQYFDQLKPALRLRIATTSVPDFVRRYPALLRRQIAGLVAGWEIELDVNGVPFAWTPLTSGEVRGWRADEVRIVWQDANMLKNHRCKQLVRLRSGAVQPGTDLQRTLAQLFSWR